MSFERRMYRNVYCKLYGNRHAGKEWTEMVASARTQKLSIRNFMRKVWHKIVATKV